MRAIIRREVWKTDRGLNFEDYVIWVFDNETKKDIDRKILRPEPFYRGACYVEILNADGVSIAYLKMNECTDEPYYDYQVPNFYESF